MKSPVPAFTLFLFSLLSHPTISAFTPCPLLGPDLPSPTNLPNSTAFLNASTYTTSIITSALSNASFGVANLSFSFAVFSTYQSAPIYTYYHAAKDLNSTAGTKTVNGDSIFRIGSVSKLYTILLFLIEAGDVHFSDSITKWVPELLAAAKGNKDPANKVDWADVTVGGLASQMSGIGRDYSNLGEFELLFPKGTPFDDFGLPPLNNSEIPPCGPTNLCSRKQFFDNFPERHPVFAPFHGPSYSNAAFQILAYALESITGKSYEELFREDIIQKLHLSGTTYTVPEDSSRGVIPGNAVDSYWNVDIGAEGPAGGVYSTTNDMAKFGRAILSSTLLSPAQTRRWLKPVSFSASLQYSVGAPWEIFRLALPTTSVITDAYTKTGGLGYYTAEFFLIPSLSLGFIALTASPTDSGTGAALLSELASETLVSAAAGAAREEAQRFVGAYAADTKTGLNSSLEIGIDEGKPGLGIKRWISNGTDVLSFYAADVLGTAGLEVGMRLYPSGLDSQVKGGGEQLAWRAVIEPIVDNGDDGNVIKGGCTSWTELDSLMYGGVALDDFLFTIGKDGGVESVEPRALRVVLGKE